MRSLLLVVAVLGCGGSEAAPTASADAGAAPSIPVGQPPRRAKPPNVVGGFSMALPKVTLQPGEEKSYCFASPITMTGPSYMIGGAVLRVGKGMHHGNVTTRPQRVTKPGGGIVGCGPSTAGAIGGEGQDVIDGGSVLFGSTTQVAGEEWQSFPEGMAFRVKPGFEIAARMHYLNATREPIDIAPVYEWFTVDESKVRTELAPFFWVNKNINIPPHTKQTIKASCALPTPMKIVTLMPHMHKLATGFTAGYLGGPLDGKNFLESKGYDPDKGLIMQWDPGVDTAQGEGVTFSCSWENTFDKTIVEGIGDNEMCMAFGYGYPAGKVYTLLGAENGVCPAIAPAP